MPPDVTARYQFIEKQATAYALVALCQALGVSRSGYYDWRKRLPRSEELTAKVKQAFWRHARRYGSRRLRAELRAQGELVGRHRVRTILCAEGLHAIQPKSFVPRTTDSRHGRRMSPQLLAGLRLERPRQAVVGDITYLPLQSGA